jgi:hypothetical protein
MEEWSTKDLVGAISLGALFLVALLFVRGGSSSRQPAERFFKCGGCKTLTAHNKRTIEAWRNQKTRFFCGACHAKWLRSHPAPLVQARSNADFRRRRNPVATLVMLGIITAVSLLARSCS